MADVEDIAVEGVSKRNEVPECLEKTSGSSGEAGEDHLDILRVERVYK